MYTIVQRRELRLRHRIVCISVDMEIPDRVKDTTHRVKGYMVFQVRALNYCNNDCIDVVA